MCCKHRHIPSIIHERIHHEQIPRMSPLWYLVTAELCVCFHLLRIGIYSWIHRNYNENESIMNGEATYPHILTGQHQKDLLTTESHGTRPERFHSQAKEFEKTISFISFCTGRGYGNYLPYSIISTVKLHDYSAWDLIETFFKNIFNTCGDYVNRIFARIA